MKTQFHNYRSGRQIIPDSIRESVVSSIAEAVVRVNVSGMTSEIHTVVPILLLDYSHKEAPLYLSSTYIEAQTHFYSLLVRVGYPLVSCHYSYDRNWQQ